MCVNAAYALLATLVTAVMRVYLLCANKTLDAGTL